MSGNQMNGSQKKDFGQFILQLLQWLMMMLVMVVVWILYRLDGILDEQTHSRQEARHGRQIGRTQLQLVPEMDAPGTLNGPQVFASQRHEKGRTLNRIQGQERKGGILGKTRNGRSHLGHAVVELDALLEGGGQPRRIGHGVGRALCVGSVVLGGHVGGMTRAHNEGKLDQVVGTQVGGPKIQERHECGEDASRRKENGMPAKLSPNHGRTEIAFFG